MPFQSRGQHEVAHGIFVRKGPVVEQAKKIVDFLDIKDSVKPFSRCLRCNSLLAAIAKEKIEDRIPPKAKQVYNEYTYCKTCNKIYWRGTHCAAMKELIDEILT